MKLHRSQPFLVYWALFLFTLVMTSCDSDDSKRLYRIGVSQCSSGHWRQKQNNEMLRELLLQEQATLEIRCAEDDDQKQIADIQYFIDEKVDILVVSPHDAVALIDIIAKAYRQGMPVLLFDRRVNGEEYTAFVGGDNVGVGKQMAAYLTTRLRASGGQVLEIMGDMKTSPALLRHEGLHEGLNKSPNIQVVASVDAGWMGPIAFQKVDSLLKRYPQVDAIVAHSDYMADQAKRAADRLLPGNKIIFVGADGFGAPGIGIEAVEKGNLDASAIYPTGGDVIIQTALKILRGEKVERQLLLTSNLVSTPQEALLLINMDKVLTAEVQRVERMHDRALFYLQQSRLERMLLYASLGILVLACGFCILFYRLNNLRRASNKRLHEQQNTLRQQNEQLLTMTKELEEATNAKLVFFTNISHDFRTPLTLIAAPIEEALTELTLGRGAHPELMQRLLSIAQRNVKVLLDLVNQILDFRKVENGKMQLSLQRVNIYEQMRGWRDSFLSLAQRRGIDLQLSVGEGEWLVHVDIKKLERMVYNLVGNSIKFTPHGGTIQMACLKGEELIIKVSDTGPGMDRDQLNLIFERFYQIDHNNSEGSGIGLALVKKYTELMGGRIDIESHTAEHQAEATGTVITLHIPLSTAEAPEEPIAPHLEPDQLLACSSLPSTNHEATDLTAEDESLPLALVIDDNADMRSFITTLLQNQYRLLTAVDGEQGLLLAKQQVPDIIICDVMMPVMDGLECCRQLKSDMVTSHIPVVMLTACSLDEQRVQGMQCGAESYLAKPFNSSVLLAQMETLLQNRVRIAQHHASAISRESQAVAMEVAADTPQTDQRLSRYDRTFLDKMSDSVESHYTDPAFNVETLADMVCLSRTQLYRKCKALTGETPVEYIRNTRLEHAHQLLTTSSDSIAEVARAVGIPDATYFSKCYKAYFGIMPSQIKV